MSEDKTVAELKELALTGLSPADRAWLEERLTEYEDLLAYLRDH
jgi:hypothetical protein